MHRALLFTTTAMRTTIEQVPSAAGDETLPGELFTPGFPIGGNTSDGFVEAAITALGMDYEHGATGLARDILD